MLRDIDWHESSFCLLAVVRGIFCSALFHSLVISLHILLLSVAQDDSEGEGGRGQSAANELAFDTEMVQEQEQEQQQEQEVEEEQVTHRQARMCHNACIGRANCICLALQLL